MLFYLLELEYLIARMDVEESVDRLIEIFKQKVGPMSNEDEEKVREQVRPFLVHLVINQSLQAIDELEEGYHVAVEELSFIAPFIAYRLKGRTKLVKRFEVIRSMLEQAPQFTTAVTVEEMDTLADVFDGLAPEFIAEDLEVARRELVALSLQIGPIAFLKAKRRVWRSSSFTDDDQQDMEDFVEQYLSVLAGRHQSRTSGVSKDELRP